MRPFFCTSGAFRLPYDSNALQAYVPELWANESVLILMENMVAANLVHRDFENYIAQFGDVVNTRKPAEFTALRKTNDDDVTIQAAKATNIPVPLNQQWHTSFMIKDGEESKSFKQLRDEYLHPGVLSLARAIDQMVLGQVYQFLPNAQGNLGQLSGTTVKDALLNTRKQMNINKAYEEGRNMIWTPSSETEALKLDWFVNAEKVGDDGTALREASLGRRFGFQNFMCQNTPSIAGLPITASVVTTSAEPAGTTVLPLTAMSSVGIPVVGQWLVVAGDWVPQKVTVVGTITSTAGNVTVTPGLKNAVISGAAVTLYKTALVNQAVSPAGYATGYSKEIEIDGLTGIVETGSMVTFAAAGTPNVRYAGTYCVIQHTETSGNTTGITLDRPLDAAIATLGDEDVVCFGPGGDYNFAFHKNSLALVCRPLAPAPAGLAISSVQNMNGISIRVTMTYHGIQQGVLVTLDLLTGIATLDQNLGAVMLG